MFRRSADRVTAARLDKLLKKSLASGFQVSTGQPEASLDALISMARQLETLRPVPVLAAASLASARQAFAAQTTRMRLQAARSAAPAPISLLNRLSGWFSALLIMRKPAHRTLSQALVSLILLVLGFSGLTFGGLSLSARSSLPGDGLYAYKLAQEDLDLALTFNSAERVNLYLEMAGNRSQELIDLIKAGRPVSVETAARLQEHFRAALYTASRLPDAQMAKALVQIHQASLDTQNLLDEMVVLTADDTSLLTLASTATAMNSTTMLAAAGLQDPESFREEMDGQVLLPTGTLVVLNPTATNILLNPPEASLTPSLTSSPPPGVTSIPPAATATPSGTPEQQPTLPATRTATPVSAGTPAPTNTAQPSATRTPQPPPPNPTPTPISPGGGG